ncbi:RrF2 family transcriptional regulator [[Clostridium] innocuum]|uniref:RrF2 family transcriptional regulator n=1 Tax=Clostridium innocuum TaxID=1522 RepID=UPI0032D2B260
MKISTKGIYALEAMIELVSRNTACVSIRDIADARNCSVKYLEQIFKQLKKAQLLISIRGKDGGYQIAKDPEEITAKDIILAVEEKLDPVVCLSHTCTRSGICRTQPVWMGMQEQIYKVLESKTLKYLTDIYRNEVSA